MDTPALTPDLLRRFDRPVPRYTSYPTADRFSQAFDAAAYEAALARADAVDAPLSLYVHLPFCRKLCGYCGCAVVVSSNDERKARYLDRVLREIDLVADRLPHRRRVAEIHLGGGTPNSHPPEELARLMAHLEDRFEIDPRADRAIELDPRISSEQEVRELKDIGFTRISVGVQDFDPHVQAAVGRIQSVEITAEVIRAARSAGMRSVNVDLIYGLPEQTRRGFDQTVTRVLELLPDRIALFSFAYVPAAKPHQKKLNILQFPSADDKIASFCDARARFLEAGYTAIGMDHFAQPDDDLASAHARGALGRNFQGYTVVRGADTIGFGMSAIGEVGGAYAQNAKTIAGYDAAIDAGRLPIARGVTLTHDDLARRFAIRELMCGFRVDLEAVAQQFGIDVAAAGSSFDHALRGCVDDGLATRAGRVVTATPLGRLFIRNVAAALDARLAQGDAAPAPYARAI